MSEHIDISVKGIPDFGDVESKLQQIGDKAKKTKIGIPNPTSSSTSSRQIPASKVTNKASGNSTNSVFQSKDRGAVAASMVSSDIDEGARGGFYNALNSKVNLFKGIGSNKNIETNEPLLNKESAKTSLDNGKKEINEAIFKNVKIENMNGNSNVIGNLRGSSPSSGTSPASGGVDFSGGEEGGRGSIISKIGGAIPFIGGAIAAATAGALKLVSDVGQRHVSAIQSQIGTIGATGRYVGGGEGYFDNSQVASAKISRSRINGNSTDPDIDKQEMMFAYSQGRGLSEIVDSMAKLKKENGSSLNFYRGAAQQAGFSNLRQSEYLTKLGDMSESLRSKGYSGDMSSFSSSLAGLSIGGFGDPSRKMSVAESIGEKSRSGVFGGGVVGGLAMAEALKESGGDFDSAMKLLEGKDGHKYGMNALSGFDSMTRGVLFKQQGIGSYTEGSGYSFDPNKQISAATDLSISGQRVTEMNNKINEQYAGSTGAQAAETGFKLTEGMLKSVEALNGPISALAETITQLEDVAFKELTGTLQVMAPSLTKLASGDFAGVLKEIIQKALSESGGGFNPGLKAAEWAVSN